MSFLNVEIKARCNKPDQIEKILLSNNAVFIGEDRQVDTYFFSPKGRLKIREGNIENSLIFYQRDNISGPKNSNVILEKISPDSEIKNILIAAYDAKVAVEKKRKIFFIENVKFHVDTVKNLGDFVEIEAIDKYGTIGEKVLNEQCTKYIELLGIKSEDLLNDSYSDMLLR